MASANDSLKDRAVEAMLWRGAWALCGDRATSDAALAAVHRACARPSGASESRMLRVVLDCLRAAGVDLGDDREVARKLVVNGGVPAEVVGLTLEVTSPEAPAGPVPGDDEVRAALARVDALTAGLRRRRRALNVLKFAAFGAAVLLVVYVMFDLREAANQERLRQRPADVFSLPMPAQKADGK